MRAVDRLFQEHDVRLKKIANVFAYKSRRTIEREEFYQEFAVRLLELNLRYKDKPAKEFIKILNFSLHNLACDMLKSRFRIVYFSEDTLKRLDSIEQVDYDNPVLRNSFLYFYKQAMFRLLQDAKSAEVFGWLVENPDIVETLREEKNLAAMRCRRVAFSDVVESVCTRFDMIPNVARHHIRAIKNCLKQVWVLEGGI